MLEALLFFKIVIDFFNSSSVIVSFKIIFGFRSTISKLISISLSSTEISF